MYLARAGTDSEVVIRKLAPSDSQRPLAKSLLDPADVGYAGRTTVTSERWRRLGGRRPLPIGPDGRTR